MRKIAIRTKKGGVGKTTTAGNIGHYLAMKGKSVCIIDADPQYNLTTMFSVDPTDIKGTIRELMGGWSFGDCIKPVRENLYVIPATSQIADVKRELDSVLEQLTLSKKLGEFSEYDFLIFDCPPGTNILIDNILCYVDEVWSPLQTEFFSFDGIEQVLEELAFLTDNFKALGVHPQVTAVIPTLHNKRTGLAGEVLEAAKERYPNVLTNPIHRSIKIAESPSHGQTIFEYDPKGTGSEDYQLLGERLING